MAELVRFQNFAKLKDTSVEFNDITVLAGKPSTGKSYVMKMAYVYNETSTSFVNGLNIKSIIQIEKIMKPLLKDNKLLKQILNSSFESDIFDKLSDGVEKKFQEKIKNLLNSIFTNIEQISDSFSVEFSNKSIRYENQILKINITKTGKESFEKTMEKPFDMNMHLKLDNSIIFVETPLILEFHKYMDKREGKTPYHIESLLNILDEDYSFTDEEQDKFIRDFSQKVNRMIGGDIKNRNGSFVFSRNNDKDYNIFNASSGTKSIGLLQYLVTNKALKKGSILFWEEPEVHLHPTWQLKMVDLFIELMNAGVKIVFSTHSPYMADYLNAISKRNGYRERISFNVLDEKDGVVTNHILDDDNWDILQKELMDTFEDILWQYL
jgi:predicted ATPase